MYQLFVLFMITDPKTTVSTRNGRCLVAFLVALAEFLFRLNEAVYALFVVGPVAKVIDLTLRDTGGEADKKDAEGEKIEQVETGKTQQK